MISSHIQTHSRSNNPAKTGRKRQAEGQATGTRTKRQAPGPTGTKRQANGPADDRAVKKRRATVRSSEKKRQAVRDDEARWARGDASRAKHAANTPDAIKLSRMKKWVDDDIPHKSHVKIAREEGDASTEVINVPLQNSEEYTRKAVPETFRVLKESATRHAKTKQPKRQKEVPPVEQIQSHRARANPIRQNSVAHIMPTAENVGMNTAVQNILNTYENAYKTDYDSATCDRTGGIVLKSQQKFVTEYMNHYTPYTGLVLWHGLGSGKTLSAISIAEQIAVSHQTPKVIVVAPAMLEANFRSELDNFEGYYRNMNVRFNDVYSYFSANGKLLTQNNTDNFSRSIKNAAIIMDESQLFIAAVLKKMEEIEADGRRRRPRPERPPIPTAILNNYNAIMRDDTCRVVCLSGTPIVSSVREIAVLINLLAKCPKMYEFKNIHSITEFSWESVIRKYSVDNAKLDVLLMIDFIRSDISGDNIRIVRNPIRFISTEENTIVYAENNNTKSDEEYQRDLISIFGHIIKQGNKEPVFDLNSFDASFNLIHEGELKAYNINDIGTRDINLTPRTSTITNVEIFKRKCVGFISYFGNIDKILPKTGLYPDDPMLRTGLSYSGAPLFTIRRCEYINQITENVNTQMKESIRRYELGWLDFMTRSAERFMYPFLITKLEDIDDIMHRISAFWEDRINAKYNSTHKNAFYRANKINSAEHFKYYMQYIHSVLRNMKALDGTKMVKTYSLNHNIITQERENRVTNIENEWPGNNDIKRALTTMLSGLELNDNDDNSNLLSRRNILSAKNAYVNTITQTLSRVKAFRCCWHRPGIFTSHPRQTQISLGRDGIVPLIYLDDLNETYEIYTGVTDSTGKRQKHPISLYSRPSGRDNNNALVKMSEPFDKSDVDYLNDIREDPVRLASCSPKLPHLNTLIDKSGETREKIIIYSEYKQTSIPLTRVLFNPDKYEELKIEIVNNKVRIINANDDSPGEFVDKLSNKIRYMFITGSGDEKETGLDTNIFTHFLTKKTDKKLYKQSESNTKSVYTPRSKGNNNTPEIDSMAPGESEINKLEGNTNTELKQHYINIFNGDISDPIYSDVKHITDSLKKRNQHICDIVILNSAAAEGITLKEVRHVVLYHAPADMSKIYQIIGRAVRNCTHTKLPDDKRTVMPILFVNKNMGPDESTEETHFNKLVNVSETFVPYLNALKETAIDCKLNSEITTKPDGTLLYPDLRGPNDTLKCLVK